MRPEWSFTLLDSNSKKTGFVQQAVIELGLRNVKSVAARGGSSGRPEQKFDGIISRAFAEAADFVTLTRHLLADGGRWAAMKGAPEQELARLPEGCQSGESSSVAGSGTGSGAQSGCIESE